MCSMLLVLKHQIKFLFAYVCIFSEKFIFTIYIEFNVSHNQSLFNILLQMFPHQYQMVKKHFIHFTGFV